MLHFSMEAKWIQVLQHWSYSWNRITAILEMQSTHRRNINLLDLWSRCYNILNPRHLFSISRSWRKSARWHGPIKPTSQACHWNYITVISTREQKNPTKKFQVLLTFFLTLQCVYDMGQCSVLFATTKRNFILQNTNMNMAANAS